MRWLLEGEWSGYRSGQSRVVHRVVLHRKQQAERFRKITGVGYSDGTSLMLTVTELKPRQRVTEIRGYTKLLLDCYYSAHDGFHHVDEFIKKA